VTNADEAALTLLGYSFQELEGKPLHDIVHRDYSGTASHNPGSCMLYSAVRDRTEKSVTDEEFRGKDGASIPVEYVTTPTRTDGRLTGAEVIVTDLRAGDATGQALSDDESTAGELLVEKAPMGVCVTDRDGTIVTVNATLCRLLDFSRSEMLGKHFSMMVPHALRESASKVYSRRFPIKGDMVDEFEVETKSGEIKTIQSTTVPMSDEEENEKVTWFVLDITDRRNLEKKLGDMAHADQLTGLPNQVLFQDRLEQSLAYAHRRGQLTALLSLDLDDFARINEKLGSANGDELLKRVAARLKDSTRAEDTVCRMGGNKFAVILPDAGSAQNAGVVAQKIREAFANRFTINGQTVALTASIGISIYPFDARDHEGLLSKADAAMHHAKELGKDRAAFHGREEE
jgi:diguanylate cyclase (GGDEF)-like protein/PAS domain S-box-containing protein